MRNNRVPGFYQLKQFYVKKINHLELLFNFYSYLELPTVVFIKAKSIN